MATRRFDVLAVCVGLVLAIAVSTSSCSLILDLDSCSDDTDCEEGFICSPDQICFDSSAQCASDDECVPLFGDGASCEAGVCKGDNPLTGGPCQQLYGAADDEEAFIIGVVMQLSGVGGGFGQPMLDAIRIATRDINTIGGVDDRRLGLVACDTAYDELDPADYGEVDDSLDTMARIGARHLVEEAGVEAIIGFNSSQVLDVGPNITAENDVLLMSPSATAAAIPPENHQGLIWRTAPSDEAQAITLTRTIEELLGNYLVDQSTPEPKVTVLIRDDDAWAQGLYEHLKQELEADLNEEEPARFTSHTFPNVGAGDIAEYEPVAASVLAESPPPDLVVVLGSADSWELIRQIDDVVEHEPLYLGADAMKNLEEAAQAPSELEHRIWGTGPRNVAEFDYEPYTIFRLKFEREMHDDADNYQFVANAFDALYTVAFAAAAEGFTGPELATGLSRLDSGTEIFPSSSDADQAIELLSGGQTIDYQGASGPINFDDNGNPEPMPIALWCFEDGQVPERGELYAHDTGQFQFLTCDPPASEQSEPENQEESD